VEKDRVQAVCRFCDTDFVGTDGPGGGKFANAASLARAVFAQWPAGAKGKPYVICTGGEPLLQLDKGLVVALHDLGFEIGIETNGTLLPPAGIDWICVSPKADAEQKLKHGDELKLVFPQAGAEPERYAGQDFRNFFLQPMDGPDRAFYGFLASCDHLLDRGCGHFCLQLSARHLSRPSGPGGKERERMPHLGVLKFYKLSW
jgi:7-carboxy-7-deazaguanine synthase (Cx14CxxC type)